MFFTEIEPDCACNISPPQALAPQRRPPSLRQGSVLSAEKPHAPDLNCLSPPRMPSESLSSWRPLRLRVGVHQIVWATSPAGEFLCLQNQGARGSQLLPRACLHRSELHGSWNIYEFSACVLSLARPQKLRWPRGWNLWPPRSHSVHSSPYTDTDICPKPSLNAVT